MVVAAPTSPAMDEVPYLGKRKQFAKSEYKFKQIHANFRREEGQ